MIDAKKLRMRTDGIGYTLLVSLLDELDRVTEELGLAMGTLESRDRNIEAMAEEYRRVTAERDALKGDAERFLWITDDHQDPRVRTDLLDLFDRLPVMSYSAACAAIDAAIRASKGEE